MGALHRTVRLADDAACAFEKFFLIFVHAAIFVLVVVGVILRYVFNDPLTWSEELIVALFTWMVFIAAAAALRTHMHIRIDVMAPIYASPKMKWLNGLTLLVGIAIILVALYACVDLVAQELVVDSPMLNVSKAWFVAAMPAGLVLMLVHIARLWLDKGVEVVFRGEVESVIAGEKP